MASGIDAAPPELLSLFIRQVPMISLVEHAVCKGAARANRKEVAFEARTIRIDIINSRTLFYED